VRRYVVLGKVDLWANRLISRERGRLGLFPEKGRSEQSPAVTKEAGMAGALVQISAFAGCADVALYCVIQFMW
jgi:hypothetical protein